MRVKEALFREIFIKHIEKVETSEGRGMREKEEIKRKKMKKMV